MTAAGKSSGKKLQNGLSQSEPAHFFSLPNITFRAFDEYTIWYVWGFFCSQKSTVSVMLPRRSYGCLLGILQGSRYDSLK